MTTPYIHDSAERQRQATQLSPEAQTFNWLLDSFTSGTAGVLEAVAVSSDGLLMAMSSISAGSVLGVIADRSANLGAVAYEMTLFASRAGGALTPRLIVELKNAVQQ